MIYTGKAVPQPVEDGDGTELCLDSYRFLSDKLQNIGTSSISPQGDYQLSQDNLACLPCCNQTMMIFDWCTELDRRWLQAGMMFMTLAFRFFLQFKCKMPCNKSSIRCFVCLRQLKQGFLLR